MKNFWQRYREAVRYSDNIQEQWRYQHDDILREYEERQEREKLIEDIASRVTIKVDDRLRKVLDDLFKQYLV